ncbi:MAG TPA: metallopeptidase family protein [Gemmatimonadales bacterium]|nr:metallopeptidase family protein [Gemmatimonadales bacterium]
MRLADFEVMVQGMAAELPAEFLEGIAEIVVSPATLPHPVHADVYTLGECIPLPATADDVDSIQSRVVLYHGSFQALGGTDPEFDWREEAWETLTHEIRHHLEWRARAPALEALDAAAEANFARQDGQAFDPTFYRDGEEIAPGIFRVEDDYFLELRPEGQAARFTWHGRAWIAELPEGIAAPAFLTVHGLEEPPPGALVVVIPRRTVITGFFKAPVVFQADVEARAVFDQKES